MGSFADIDQALADVPAEIDALVTRVEGLTAPAASGERVATDAVTRYLLEMGRGPLSVRSLLQLHRVLLEDAGEPRAGLPADAQRGMQLTELVAQYEMAVSRRRHPPLLLACALVSDFAAVGPFEAGNERMARLLLMRELRRHGYAVAVDETVAGWDAALEASGQDLWVWAEYVLGVVAEAYETPAD